ncbi:MAG: winged helix-turn-helix domain-containing protein [Aurantimicrobium sp.]|jgi:DNA-binding winged helix-turn-helix (wHTH) protein|uniref:Transcriptional regulatory protein SrrA n=2 Tax=Microbacteriaceae TaxID=85023 RepID=A0A2Z3RZS3_9MICO|nr:MULTISPECIES: winged helix-turn-helix domain-containing protein [Aurantimicrobium]AWR22255.1 Transcriptional regulatory protein SrrA [Aurantimicrobium photophilum]MDF9809432.1 DNA-binding winged helix-turn-helix (wHTH) protein [Aurantimicrobium minutum]MDH6207428.1 DNA-binding winged helix-turn-helix (wHTH) protein [Aurantimicrobium minutum]MDH6254914.1 DNA-binding winged helix-turn-helix (wHTH) protein [Aurantimicrobium minutum]MDH6409746.1 DNA-binding winged helix-turn-helix (wHTH) protei
MSTPTERPIPKGFALYVGLDEATAAERGLDLGKVVEALKKLTNELVPGTETYAAVALAPASSRGRQVDLVRLALQEPSAVAKYTPEEDFEPSDGDGGVVVDISRKRVLIDYQAAPLTFKEFELLQFLVVHKGETISREEIIKALWREDDLDIPNERTIDVHVRRLRSKLGRFEDIVRTVRGVGYRYDTHADVTVMHAGTPSPDLF